VLSDIIDIVDDDIVVTDHLFIDMEDDANIGVEIMDYVYASEVTEEEIEEEAIPFALVEEKPKFQGGDANDFSKWVNSKLVYPEIAKENGVQGRVTLQFTVYTDGSVRDVKVLRGVDASLDREAVRIVSSSPKWTPGKQRERPVKVTYTFPVLFQLR
jgi:protein TonB